MNEGTMAANTNNTVEMRVGTQQQINQPVQVIQVDQFGNPIQQVIVQQQPVTVVAVNQPVVPAGKQTPTCCCNDCCNLNVSVLVLFIIVILGAIGNLLKWTSWDLGDFDEVGIVVSASFLGLAVLLGVAYWYALSSCQYQSQVALGICNTVFASIAIWILLFFLICTCFSADSMVWLRRKQFGYNKTERVSLREINVGDQILNMNPTTNEVFWDEVLMKIHYSWYDNSNEYYYMRKLHLENNVSSITLSYDHLIFINENGSDEPKVIQTENVKVGDMLYYYDYENGMEGSVSETVMRVIEIEENVKSQKRVFFTINPHLLINNIVASPYIGPHPLYHNALHTMFTNLIFLKHIGIESVLAVVALVGYFGIYGSWFLIQYWVECGVFVASAAVMGVFVRKTKN